MSKKDAIDEDEPVEQYLRVVQVLRCAPGYAKKPLQGEPIAIITCSHDGEVEQPLMLRMRDAKFLAYHLLLSLGFHEVELARDIVSSYPKLDADWNDLEEDDDDEEVEDY